MCVCLSFTVLPFQNQHAKVASGPWILPIWWSNWAATFKLEELSWPESCVLDSSLRVESSLPVGLLGCIIGRGMEHSYAKTNSPHTFEVDDIQVSFDVIIASFQYDPNSSPLRAKEDQHIPLLPITSRCCFHLHLCSSILQKNVTSKVKAIPWPENPLLTIRSFNLTLRLPRPLSYILRHTFSYLDQTNCSICK